MLGCIGVDVGGTNTDAVVVCGRQVLCEVKKPTTRDVISGVKNATRHALTQVRGKDPSLRICQVNIGTTHFVNAVVQRQGLAKVSVIRLCGTASIGLLPYVDFPPDLAQVIRGEVYTVKGGYQFDGEEIAAVDEDEIKACAEDSRKKGVKNFVISGIFSPVKDVQELKAGDVLQSVFPEASFTLSHQVGHTGLIERENAAILNECLKPLCDKTIRGFKTAFDDLGLTCPFYLTQNDGTIISSAEAARFPVKTFASGPTNSMRGAAFLTDEPSCIVVDIGGTTTDVGALVKGFPREASAQIKVGGVRTNFRMPDVFSVGLGGGSVVDIKDNQQVSVGPRSTGYRLLSEALAFGGDTFTATDAAILMNMADLGDKVKVKQRVSVVEARATIDKIRVMLEEYIDQMKVSKEDAVVILVGGGSILVDNSVALRGVKQLLKPRHYQVANAIGAAISQISGTVDYVVSLTNVIGEERFARAVADARESGGPNATEQERTAAMERSKMPLFAEARAQATEQATEKAKALAESYGADVATLQLVEVLDISLAYIPGNARRIKVKVVGDMFQGHGQGSSVGSGTLPQTTEHADHELPAPTVTDQQVQKTTATGQSLGQFEDPGHSAFNPLTYTPTVDPSSGEWSLSEFDVDCITIGAGILGCGGGGSPRLGNVLAKQILQEGKKIRVISAERFVANADPHSTVACVGLMGAPVVLYEKLSSVNELKLALDAMETLLRVKRNQAEVIRAHGGEVLNKNGVVGCDNLPSTIKLSDKAAKGEFISALMSPEIGGLNSVQPLLLGAEMSLPVIDCDGMGRAYPELQMYAPFIYGQEPFPASLADDKGRQAVVLKADTAKDLENYFRDICVDMGCSAALIINPLRTSDLLQKTIIGSLSRAWSLGRAVHQARVAHISPITAIINEQNGKLLITGKISDVSLETTGGFSRGIMTIEGLGEFAGQEVTVDFQNENLIARSGQRILASTPDLITCVDTDRGEPITTEEVRFGLRVSVLALPSCPEMASPEALRVVGPQAFGYSDVTYKPIGQYVNPTPVPK